MARGKMLFVHPTNYEKMNKTVIWRSWIYVKQLLTSHWIMAFFICTMVKVFILSICPYVYWTAQIIPELEVSNLRQVGFSNLPFSDDRILLLNEHPELCHTPKGEAIFAMVIVFSATNNFAARRAIRHTWGNVSHSQWQTVGNIKLAFLLGQTFQQNVQSQILEEDAQFHDVLIANFDDSYYNLTLKGMAMLKWTNTNCQNAQYLIKVDDDCFLHPANVLHLLQSRSENAAIYGWMASPYMLFDNPYIKWYLPSEKLPNRIQPSFIIGATYVYTRDAVHKVYSSALNATPFHLEDMFFNGVCAEKANVQRIHIDNFVDFTISQCFYPKMFTVHAVLPHQMNAMWQLINEGKHWEICLRTFATWVLYPFVDLL